MPGSPPTRIAEAGTKPPPRTRSNSAIPDCARGGGVSWVARSVSSMAEPRRAPKDLLGGPAEMPLSSTIEFQAPQASQRPDHLECFAPHSAQEKLEEDLAMGPFRAGAGWRQRKSIRPLGDDPGGEPNGPDAAAGVTRQLWEADRSRYCRAMSAPAGARGLRFAPHARGQAPA